MSIHYYHHYHIAILNVTRRLRVDRSWRQEWFVDDLPQPYTFLFHMKCDSASSVVKIVAVLADQQQQRQR
jgi:hypothetical protein